ncbi:right-handed parallel beta-helix repeat-containing protein [Deinococcus sedimenti]|uniref:Right handed beta helix domain-containing protein n=1 Tax=Deinococcus sedimenti TaxID=1867090 RepID=A0ABQ2S5P7_9DEIO|nr:right-handed parallel beta-helix repeat-containing protein [Deinococcus sedimenti]GGR93147.1 hypothetical protein GCM10008960_20150 [Deinococcus sedimenti]
MANYLTLTGDQTDNVKRALQDAQTYGVPMQFPARTIVLQQVGVLRLPSNAVIRATGTVFDIALPGAGTDGVIFTADSVSALDWSGGTFTGHRSDWSPGANVSPIAVSGASHDIAIRDVVIDGFTAPGIKLVGSDITPIRQVTLERVTLQRNGAYYYDYLERPPGGQAEGTEETDKGQLLLHHVSGFTVRDSVIQDAPGDGTYFRWCQQGVIDNVQFLLNKMGGLLLSECADVTVQSSLMDGNGSRNVTVEWGSERIKVLNNVMQNGGRQGIWGWGWYSGELQGNTFRHNGQKRDRDLTADVEVGEWVPGGLPQRGEIVMTGNRFETDQEQMASVHIRSQVAGAVVKGNEFGGPGAMVRADSLLSGVSAVTVSENKGWWTERSGTVRVPVDGNRSVTFEHGLSFSDPDDVRSLVIQKIVLTSPTTELGSYQVKATTRTVTVTFDRAPTTPADFHWQAHLERAR